jgi:hypothetical protein
VWKSRDHPQRDTDGVSDRHAPSQLAEGSAVSVSEVWAKFLVATAKEEAVQSQSDGFAIGSLHYR